MKLSNIERLTKMDLLFGTEQPSEECSYLVVGKIECPNGFVGPQFLVCVFLIGDAKEGKWYVAPDGLAVNEGLPMWDGLRGTVQAPFTPIKWAQLPQRELEEGDE